MDTDIEQEAQLNKIQSMKAAIHFTVGRICEEVGVEVEMSFSKQVIATLTEITFKQLETYTKDLEAFSKHARRATITADDVKLLVRRNSKLAEHIEEMSKKMDESSGKDKKKRGRKPKPSTSKETEDVL